MPSYSSADLTALLSLCRGVLAGSSSQCLAIESSHWPGVLAAATDHGLIGPVHSASVLYAVPEHTFHSIHAALIAQVVANLRLTDALFELLPRFRDSGIDVVVLKGPAVAVMAFGEISTREFTDLDLLVHPEDLSRARALLGEMGYDGSPLGIGRTEKDVQFVRRSDGLLLELHWAVNAPAVRFSLEQTGTWERVQTVHFHGERICTLSLEDTLLALCIHGTKHGWYSLKWAFDIAQILRRKREEIDWAALTWRCRQAGCLRTLLIGLRLVCDLFGEDAPVGLANYWNDASAIAVADRMRSAILNLETLPQADIIAAQIRGHDRLWDRVAVMVTISVPELPKLLPDSVSPVKNGPLRFVTRPVRLVKRYGAAWVRSAILNR